MRKNFDRLVWGIVIFFGGIGLLAAWAEAITQVQQGNPSWNMAMPFLVGGTAMLVFLLIRKALPR